MSIRSGWPPGDLYRDDPTGVVTDEREPLQTQSVREGDHRPPTGFDAHRMIGLLGLAEPEGVHRVHRMAVREERDHVPIFVPRAGRLMKKEHGRSLARMGVVDAAATGLHIRLPDRVIASAHRLRSFSTMANPFGGAFSHRARQPRDGDVGSIQALGWAAHDVDHPAVLACELAMEQPAHEG